MRLNFKHIEISNFLCFENETFDFDKHNGLVLICGKNMDIVGSKNGTGKCLDPYTSLTIEIPSDQSSLTRLSMFFNVDKPDNKLTVNLLDIYNLFKIYPELKRKLNVLTRFGFKTIEECAITAKNSEVFEVETETGKILQTSPDHLLLNDKNEWVKVKTLSKDDKICTKDGLERIVTCEKLFIVKDLYDIQVADVHEFYANGFVSHNSSIVSSIVYALYGQTPNNVKNSSIYNRFTKSKELNVALWFEIDDKQYKVISSTNKYGNPQCQLLELAKDGTEIDLTKSSIAETRKFIANELLHCDIDLFLRTIMLTSDNTYNFFKLSKGDKRLFIEQLFDIGDFGLMYNAIHSKILSLEKTVTLKQNTLINLNKNKEQYCKLLNDYDIQQKDILAKILNELKELTKKYEQLKNITITNHTDEIAKYNSSLNKILDAQTKANEYINDKTAKISNCKLKIKHLEKANDNNLKIINKHNELLSRLCDDCKIIFKDYYDLNTYQSETAENNKQIEKLTSELSVYTKELESCNSKKSVIVEKLELVNKKIKDLTAESNTVNQKIAELNAKIKFKKQEYEQHKNEVNPYKKLLNVTEQNIDAEEKELAKIVDEYNHYEYAQNIVSPDSIRKIVVKEMISILNNRIKYYLSKIGSKFDTVFDENMNYTFITEGGECEYGSFSSGEKMRINLATSFAFRDFLAFRSNLTSNILILDELIDSNLDSMAIENIIDILKEFVVQYKNVVYLISHRKEISDDIFNEIIQVVKENNISTIHYLSN